MSDFDDFLRHCVGRWRSGTAAYRRPWGLLPVSQRARRTDPFTEILSACEIYSCTLTILDEYIYWVSDVTEEVKSRRQRVSGSASCAD